jgi:hypothetical protein
MGYRDYQRAAPGAQAEESKVFWFHFFLFQAVEVLCASPTSLQKFCQLKAGIQQHGNTLAS